MTDTTNEPNLEAAKRRIEGLLRKAEGTDNPHEAEAFSAKAFELMERYRIDLATFKVGDEETFVRDLYDLTQFKFLRASLRLLDRITYHYGVVCIIGATGNSKRPILVGDRDDIAAVHMMMDSLIRQRDAACVVSPVPLGLSTNAHRNSFCYGYADRIGTRLKAIRDARITEAHGNSVALELVDRHQRVLDMLAGAVGGKPNQNRPDVYAGSVAAGKAAADRADLGQSRIGNDGPRAIGGGR
jgi:hypothetical protein